jgi:hypothetical protein
MGYGPDPRPLAGRLDGDESVGVTLYRDGGEAYVRRDGEEARLVPGEAVDLLEDVPDGVERAWSAVQNPNAGDVVVSAAPGYEFADLAGRHHVGGGSHGSLEVGDSEVPMLTVGIDAMPRSIVDVAPAIIRHLGVGPPAYQRARRSIAV